MDQAEDPKRRMLDWIRRLESFGDERALREPPAAIAGIDAVRLMTVQTSGRSLLNGSRSEGFAVNSAAQGSSKNNLIHCGDT